ncbi:sensor histidine kinase [Gottfriedia sp. NPDC057991]|uniref:ATP-binding protein n=1 Tax=Gottfriedia sp. NPDC057991 TaxID=3346298 RepID=UPI0036DD18DA
MRLEKLCKSIQLSISNSVNEFNESDLHRMFDRFYKADQTRTGKGTGLGLPIAKSLMGKMNGNITAEYKENRLYMKCEWF